MFGWWLVTVAVWWSKKKRGPEQGARVRARLERSGTKVLPARVPEVPVPQGPPERESWGVGR